MKCWLKRIVIGSGALLVVASLVANVVLYKLGREYYLRLNDVRLDPVGVKRWPVGERARSPGEGTRVVMLGDSRALAWKSPEVAGCVFINRGIGEQTTAQVLGRMKQHVAGLRPDIVVVQVGVNDLKTIPLWPERKDQIVHDCQENIRLIVAGCRETGAVVVVTTIFPLGDVPIERKLFWSDDVASAIVEVNQFIQGLKGEGVVVMDSEKVLAGPDGKVRPQYSTDLLHLNPAGYDALNRDLAKLLSERTGR